MAAGQGALVHITNVEETAAALAAAMPPAVGGALSLQLDPAALLPVLTAQTNLIRNDIAGIGVADNAAAFTQVRQDIAGIVIPPAVSLTQVNSKLDAILASLAPVTPPVNLMPTIGLTTSVLVATEPGSVLITASPADPDGSITKVEYFDNAVFIGQRVQAPFTLTYQNVLAGPHSLTAKAYDNATPAGTAVSAASLVTINPVVVPPTIVDPIPVQII